MQCKSFTQQSTTPFNGVHFALQMIRHMPHASFHLATCPSTRSSSAFYWHFRFPLGLLHKRTIKGLPNDSNVIFLRKIFAIFFVFFRYLFLFLASVFVFLSFFFVFSCNEIFLCRLSFSHSLIIVVVVTILTPFIYLCKFTNNYVLSPATGSRKKSLYNLHLSAAVRKWTAYNLHNKRIPRFGIPHNNRVEFLPDLEVLKGICMDKRSKSHLN